MTIPEDFKTRLKIAKSKIKKKMDNDLEKRGSFMGNAFKLGTELVAAVAVGTIIGFILDFAIFRRVLKSSGIVITCFIFYLSN